jgi:ECF sigma factor
VDVGVSGLVKLRSFAGLTAEQAAIALGVSTPAAEEDIAHARSWLRVAIDRMSGHRPGPTGKKSLRVRPRFLALYSGRARRLAAEVPIAYCRKLL